MARILVVDDDPDVREVIEVSLADHRCIFAGDGEEALRTLDDHQVDVVILDVMMPVMDGLEALRRIRRDPQTKDLAVVMLTAKVGEDDHLRGYQSGADAYLTKPFDIDELATIVDDVARRPAGDRARIRDEEKAKAALLRQIERRFPA